MTHHIKRKINDFARKEDGVAAVEFAIVGSICMLSVIAVIEILTVLAISILIEGGVREAARFGITGSSGDNGRIERILEIIGDHTLGLVDMDTASVDTIVYQSFADIELPEEFTDNAPNNGVWDTGEDFVDANNNGVWDPDRGTVGLGGADEIVLYRVSYDLPFLTGLMAPVVGKNSIRLQTVVPVRNEPYTIVDAS